MVGGDLVDEDGQDDEDDEGAEEGVDEDIGVVASCCIGESDGCC